MRPERPEGQLGWHSLPSDEDLSEARYLRDSNANNDGDLSFSSNPQLMELKTPIYATSELQNVSLGEPTGSIFEPQRRREPLGPWNRIQRICTRFPIRDPSWIAASCFTFGSAVFVVNSFFLLLPRIAPELNFVGEATYFAPITSIVGNVMFILGSSAGILEALNFSRLQNDNLWHGHKNEEDGDEKGLLEQDSQHNENIHEFDINDESFDEERNEISPSSTAMTTLPAVIGTTAFIWLPSFRELYHHHLRSPMFLAAVIQLTGAMVFAIGAVAGIPGVIDLNNSNLVKSLLLLPTTTGGLCFLVAASIQVMISQRHWYLPCLWRLRWYVGFWGVVGSVGFSLAGALPYIGSEAADLQASLAGFWGSWSFMLGSALHLYVVMGDYP